MVPVPPKMVAMHLNPWHILVIAVAGWMNREQSAVVELSFLNTPSGRRWAYGAESPRRHGPPTTTNVGRTNTSWARVARFGGCARISTSDGKR